MRTSLHNVLLVQTSGSDNGSSGQKTVICQANEKFGFLSGGKKRLICQAEKMDICQAKKTVICQAGFFNPFFIFV